MLYHIIILRSSCYLSLKSFIRYERGFDATKSPYDASEARFGRAQTKPILETGDDTARAAELLPIRISGRCYDIWKVGSSRTTNCFPVPVPGHVCYLSLITEHFPLCPRVLWYMLSLSLVVLLSPQGHFLTWRNTQSWVQTPFSFGRTNLFVLGWMCRAMVPPQLLFLPSLPGKPAGRSQRNHPIEAATRELQTQVVEGVAPAQYCSMII